MRPVRLGAIFLTVLMLGGATIALAGTGGDDRGRDHDKRGWGHKGKHWGDRGFAAIRNTDGDRVGHVWFHERRDKVTVFARVNDLPAGFHGFHIHTTGDCSAADFTSAGGHFNPTGATHPNHAGDLPTLLVNADGSGTLAATTDRFSLDDLRDADGSAVIVHADPDNYANIPTDRYDPDPDEATLSTGDAGSRLACGEVR